MDKSSNPSSQGAFGLYDGEPDVMGAYLREISQVPLLTPEEELDLGEAIRGGQSALERFRHEKLSAEEQVGLWRSVSHGRRAERKMIEANLRLVISVAKRYANRGLAFADLIQEGNLGLLKAVQRFDHRMHFRFSTYATYWIRQAVSRAVAEHGRTIRIPAHITEAMSLLRAASVRLQQHLERTPGIEELVLESGLLSEEDRQSIVQLRNAGAPLPPRVKKRWDKACERARVTIMMMREPVSLEAPAGPDGDTALGEMVANMQSLGPGEEVFALMLHDTLAESLTSLSPREQLVLRFRFGLEDTDTLTLERIGEYLGVTRERVRQIEKRALDKLRADAQTRGMLIFLEQN